MWNCPECGCLGIAASLAWCPMCGKERDMPMCTVNSGGSNANALPGETGYVAPEDTVAEVPAVEVAEAAVVAVDEPAEDPADAEVGDGQEPAKAVSAARVAPKPAPVKGA